MPSVPPLIGGFHVTSSSPCWWTKTKDFSLISFVCPPEVVHFPIVIGVPRGWLKTSYTETDHIDTCMTLLSYLENHF